MWCNTMSTTGRMPLLVISVRVHISEVHTPTVYTQCVCTVANAFVLLHTYVRTLSLYVNAACSIVTQWIFKLRNGFFNYNNSNKQYLPVFECQLRCQLRYRFNATSHSKLSARSASNEYQTSHSIGLVDHSHLRVRVHAQFEANS